MATAMVSPSARPRPRITAPTMPMRAFLSTPMRIISQRVAPEKHGAPADIFQSIEKPSIPLAQELMAICDLTIATGGPAMVRAAYSSGKPAYGVGAGNATMVIDETANIEEAARNTRLSKTSDNGSGCSADGNLLVEASIYDRFLEQLQKEGGYLVSEEEKQKLQSAMWDADADEDLVGLDFGFGRFFVDQHFGAAMLVNAGCFHEERLA